MLTVIALLFQLVLIVMLVSIVYLLLLMYSSSLVHITIKLKGWCPWCNNGALSNGNWMEDSIREKPILSYPQTQTHIHTQTHRHLTTSHQPPPYSSNTVTDSSLSHGSHRQGKGLIPNHFETWHDNDSNPSQGLKMAQHGFIVSQAGGAELLDLNQFWIHLKFNFDLKIGVV